MNASPPVSRIAPTPNGYLHLGNAYNFVLTWLLVREAGGQLWLRIDDLDKQRVRPEYVEEIFRTLEWLGLDWDGGPEGPDDLLRRHSQILRLSQYHSAIKKLADSAQVFACSDSRATIRERREAGMWPGTDRRQDLDPAADNVALRIITPEGERIKFQDHIQGACEYELYREMPDFVLRRRDGLPAYQLASLIDDQEMGVSMIVRGEDLIHSTAAQLFLGEKLDTDHLQKTRWYHHALLRDESGDKLSKSWGALSIRDIGETLDSPAPIFAWVADWLHPGLACESLEELLDLMRQLRGQIPANPIGLPSWL